MGSADALVPHVMKAVGFGFEEIPFNSFLDCACGYGKWGFLTRVWLNLSGKHGYVVGCDIWVPYLKFCKQHHVYDDEVRCDARAIPFRDQSFDIVFACEVLEHLSKFQGRKMISEVERVMAKRLVMTTPNGLYPQDTSDGNQFQKHRSAWSSIELQGLGFEVVGVGGFPTSKKSLLLRLFGRESGLTALSSLVLLFASLLSTRIPRLGTMLVACKTRPELVRS
jgi:SAM-dependent methyltransferase